MKKVWHHFYLLSWHQHRHTVLFKITCGCFLVEASLSETETYLVVFVAAMPTTIPLGNSRAEGGGRAFEFTVSNSNLFLFHQSGVASRLISLTLVVAQTFLLLTSRSSAKHLQDAFGTHNYAPGRMMANNMVMILCIFMRALQLPILLNTLLTFLTLSPFDGLYRKPPLLLQANHS